MGSALFSTYHQLDMASPTDLGAYTAGMSFRFWNPDRLFYTNLYLGGSFWTPVPGSRPEDVYGPATIVDQMGTYGNLGWHIYFHPGTTFYHAITSRTFDHLLGPSETRQVRGSIYDDNILGANSDDKLDGDAGNDRIDGRAGNDFLGGGAGADKLNGGAGSDTATYYDAELGVTANLSNPSANTGDAKGDTYLSVENLYGSEHSDRLYGNDQANTLEGGMGADALAGGGGNDTYVLGDEATGIDKIFEGASEGTADLITSTISRNLSHYKNIENLTIMRDAYGPEVDATGNMNSNIIDASIDLSLNSLQGLGGDDTYIVGLYDIVDETVPTSSGLDTVRSAFSIDLSDDWRFRGPIENLVLSGNAAINGRGNELNNGLDGSQNSRANALRGLQGNDTYVVGAGDTVIESANQGIDTVYSLVTWTLAANVERLILRGTQGSNGTGNGLNNSIVGNSAGNVINGAAGNDTLYGAGGSDTLIGGAGSDAFVFSSALNPATNVDVIKDFSVAQDTIRLDNAVMTGLGATLGTLAAGKFWKSTTGIAHDANDRIIYETDTGRLYYDSNGRAAGGATLLAKLSAGLELTNTDFQVI